MRLRLLVVTTILALAVVPAVWGQGRGGQGQGGRNGQGPAATQQRGGQGQMSQQRGGEQQRLRLRATEQQRNQYRTCTQSADRVRTQARNMAKAAKGSGYNSADFRQQHLQLREQVRTMQQEHERLMQGLDAEQQNGVRDRTRQMDQTRDRIHQQLQAMDQELDQSTPNRERLQTQSREMEKAMKQWQKCYRQMGDDLGLQP